MVQNGDYDITLHFSKKGVIELQERVRSAISFYNNDAAEIYLSMGSLNQIFQYKLDLKGGESKKVKAIGGDHCHAGPIRGVVISNNDYLMASFSFDSVKLWSIDFNSNQKSLEIKLKQSIKVANVLSLLILPGNKYLVLATKEGLLLLYDVQQSDFVQTVEAHKKEVWELAMHTSP